MTNPIITEISHLEVQFPKKDGTWAPLLRDNPPTVEIGKQWRDAARETLDPKCRLACVTVRTTVDVCED